MQNRKRTGQDDTPPGVKRSVNVRKVNATDQFAAVVCGHKIYGHWTHWIGKTIPHIEPRERCSGCRSEKLAPLRWYGFLHCCDDQLKDEFFLEITDLAAQSIHEVIGVKEEGLWRVKTGARLLIRRENYKKRAPILCDFLGMYEGEKPLPDRKNPSPTLSKLWGQIVHFED